MRDMQVFLKNGSEQYRLLSQAPNRVANGQLSGCVSWAAQFSLSAMQRSSQSTQKSMTTSCSTLPLFSYFWERWVCSWKSLVAWGLSTQHSLQLTFSLKRLNIIHRTVISIAACSTRIFGATILVLVSEQLSVQSCTWFISSAAILKVATTMKDN